jgi:hypothetical protein
MDSVKVMMVASGLPVITSLSTSGYRLLLLPETASQPDKMIAWNNL